jgi:hypothetical protein
MATKQESNRVAWLSARLGTHTHRIMSLLGRLGDLGVIQMLKPALFQKFLNLMEQISAEKDKESDVISEIEAIERKHRNFRKEGRLQYSDRSHKAPMYKCGDDAHSHDEEGHYLARSDLSDDLCDQSAKRNAYGWLWFLLFWMQPAKSKNNNQTDQLIAPNVALGDNTLKNKRSTRRWLWFIALWYLLSRRHINNKNHQLTPD